MSQTTSPGRGSDDAQIVFDIKRRSNPSAAFAQLFEHLASKAKEDGPVAEAAKLFSGGAVLTHAQATRLDELEKQGVSASDFAVGGLPAFLGPGIVLMYDASLESLRSGEQEIDLRRLTPRDPELVVSLARAALKQVGAASVTALEMAQADHRFRERLATRAEELGDILTGGGGDGGGAVAREDWTQPGGNLQCEHCEIAKEVEPGRWERWCGTEKACNDLLWLIILFFLIWLVYKLLKWLFGEDD